jgi:nicotinate-nucleotide pyrophosphorylase (carboxylating)
MRRLIEHALAEDIGSGDITTAAVVPEGARARARIEQREPGIVACLDVGREVFHTIDPAIRWHEHRAAGEWSEGGVVAELGGSAAPILAGERTALNFLGRLSGIATLTARFVRAVEGTGVVILDTRKTTPGLRALEKRAVVEGGGTNHRAGLHDAILIKENHAALAGGVGEAVRRALAVAGETLVAVECSSMNDVREALRAGARRLLLDNMTPAQLHKVVTEAGGRAQLEASGGVTLDNVRDVAGTGVNFISVGALTHSAPTLDLSLLLEPA